MNPIKIDATHVLTTPYVYIRALEPSGSLMDGKHSSLTFYDGKLWGYISTRCLTDELEALPAGTDERIDAVQAYHTENGEYALAMIREKMKWFNFDDPTVKEHTGYGAEIQITCDDVTSAQALAKYINKTVN